MSKGAIRVGIGGWTYAPWRGTFYPEGLRQADEQAYATAHMGAIEINATYYRLQSEKSWVKWGEAAPAGFQYAVKASRYCTNRRVLAEAGESIVKFLDQGMIELGDKLGPILWQFMETKQFDPDDFDAFLALLPAAHKGIALRHALEPRHESFACAEFVALARKHRAAIVFADKDKFPSIADQTADFAYARLQCSRESEPAGYAPGELDRWARVARAWRDGEAPKGLNYVEGAKPGGKGRDVYIFMISGAKVRAPAAAEALIARLR
ncbi:MAG: DUF72 domain-containing protein [Sphingomonadaceae bacterium]|nr:DUF72 domain-containing protein [Sphingomonadaceae bacterium]